jgi:prepilin-type N-terminal cleavage/methylation domain-containing protein
MKARRRQCGFTLLETVLVLGILALLAGIVIPELYRSFQRQRLPSSAHYMRALLLMTRANAMLDGLRYRIRFAREDELDAQGGTRQPIVEVERDPLERPEEFEPVLASWARDITLAEGVRCVKVRLGKPTIELLLREVEEDEDRIEELEAVFEEEFDEDFPPLVFERDGTSQWASFVVTDAPQDLEFEDIEPEEHKCIEVILDGVTGLAWLQRTLYVEELEMMRENGWPPVLRKDFLSPIALTEDDVLEIRETRIRQQ